MTQEDVTFTGHAIECRINAEDPAREFAPCPGTVTFYHAPGGPGVRVDSHVYNGYTISPHYDSMVGKMIIQGNTRDDCIVRCRRALSEFHIDGITTTIPLLQAILDRPAFVRGEYDTGFIEQMMANGTTFQTGSG